MNEVRHMSCALFGYLLVCFIATLTLLHDITLTFLPPYEFHFSSLHYLISQHWANQPEVLVLASYRQYAKYLLHKVGNPKLK